MHWLTIYAAVGLPLAAFVVLVVIGGARNGDG